MNYSHAYNLEACSLREPVVGACPILGNPTYRASWALALKCTVIYHAQILYQLPIATIIFGSIFQLQIDSELVDALSKALHIILAAQSVVGSPALGFKCTQWCLLRNDTWISQPPLEIVIAWDKVHCARKLVTKETHSTTVKFKKSQHSSPDKPAVSDWVRRLTV